MAKTQKQRSAEFRARKAGTPEVRGIFAPKKLHAQIRRVGKVIAEGRLPVVMDAIEALESGRD